MIIIFYPKVTFTLLSVDRVAVDRVDCVSACVRGAIPDMWCAAQQE